MVGSKSCALGYSLYLFFQLDKYLVGTYYVPDAAFSNGQKESIKAYALRSSIFLSVCWYFFILVELKRNII